MNVNYVNMVISSPNWVRRMNSNLWQRDWLALQENWKSPEMANISIYTIIYFRLEQNWNFEIQKRVCVTRNKVEKIRISIMDVPNLHIISIAKFICAKPGIKRLHTNKSKIMHENRCTRRHIEACRKPSR